MNFLFLELKNKGLLTLFSWFFCFFVSYFYKETLLFILTYKTFLLTKKSYFVYTNVMEIFVIYFKLSKFISTQIFAFYFTINLFSFLTPAFYSSEFFFLKKNLLLLISLILFSIFFLISFFFPYLWLFFSNFQKFSLVNLLHFEVSISDCLSVFIKTYYLLVFYSFIITIAFILIKHLFLKREANVHFRKLIYFFIFLSLSLNLPEVYSFLTFFVMQIIYEILLFFLLVKKFLQTKYKIK